MTIAPPRPDFAPPEWSADRQPRRAPARRALVRWSWRLFQREWRQQLLILCLLGVAIAATTAGLGIITNAPQPPEGTFGHANFVVTLPGSDQALAADIASTRQAYPNLQVVEHQQIPIPGAVANYDLRDQDPRGALGQPMLRLRAGRYPIGSGEVAVTDRVASTFGLHIGASWTVLGHSRTVVGVVENPANLLDQFALVAPGQVSAPTSVHLLILAPGSGIETIQVRTSVPFQEVDGRGSNDTRVAAMLLLVLATIGLVFVGLVAAAGFTVLAHRRLRAMGMLASIGATNRQVGLTMLANGGLVGGSAAVLGSATGVLVWAAVAPYFDNVVNHRIDRFNLPWWAIGAAMGLSLITGLVAAWWPARTVSRVPIVAALSGRPPRPQPARRFAALGALALAVGLAALAYANGRHPLLIITGIVATTAGMLFAAPLAIRALSRVGGRSPIGIRLALRDLVRFQARSAAALGAVTLAVGIAVTICASAQASEAVADSTVGNLPNNELVVRLTADPVSDLLPEESSAQLATQQAAVDNMSAALHASVSLPLDAAVNPNGPVFPLDLGTPLVAVGGGAGGHHAVRATMTPAGSATSGPVGRHPAELALVHALPHGEEISHSQDLFVATPEILARYGIRADQVRPDTDIITARTDLAGFQMIFGDRDQITPKMQRLPLPRYTSAPNALITTSGVGRLGFEAVPAGWLLETRKPLTSSAIDAARRLAATAGLTVDTRQSQRSLSRLRTDATAAGLVLALGVLAMTVGLIRSETANDLRTLTATGASSSTRRLLTSATASSLGLLGALLGAAGAYLALIAWNHRRLWPLGHVPVVDLLVIVVGLPLAAGVFGFALGGQSPPAIARQPLE